MKKCLLVIPIYNEGESLLSLIGNLKDLAVGHNDVEVLSLFVDDGSSDDTRRILESENVTFISHLVNLGIGAAVQSGYKYAAENDFDFVIQVDGDGQHPPEEISKLITAAETHNEDMIIGSRFLTDTGYKPSLARKMGMMYSSGLLKLTTGNVIKDTTSGFRLTKRPLIRHFAKEYPQREAGVISLFIAAWAGFTFKEIPIKIVERTHGESSISLYRMLAYPCKTIINSIAAIIRKPL